MSSEVYKARRDRIVSYLEKEGIRIGLVTSPTNVAYLTGFACNPHERFLALALGGANRAEKLFVPLLDATAAEEAAPDLAIVPISDDDDAYALLGEQMPAAGAGSIGVEKGAVSLAKAERLQAVYPGAGFADLEQAILDMRIAKSADEIVRIRRAVDIVEEVMAHAVSYVRVGMTELALAAEIERKMRELGADRPAFETIVLTGPRSALPHGVPGQHAIRRGDFLLIDIGVQAGGYCSDITRTFVVGEASETQRAIYEAVLAANEAGDRRVRGWRPGVRGRCGFARDDRAGGFRTAFHASGRAWLRHGHSRAAVHVGRERHAIGAGHGIHGRTGRLRFGRRRRTDRRRRLYPRRRYGRRAHALSEANDRHPGGSPIRRTLS
ncbi:Xaa-Pro peptidase family protein [Cohnella rhizosphaerae]|uniref:Xaa-Pro peptidase family protein n=1 Tax=Cohnella rhizosphaerae TaxID=1457232 RepID=A0A9X4KQ18_9BACL|nr:Xaa-Pro peptidase family protein [Cohnella rhizosphaerae]MDG0808700.1 Xaa-Pro peptidase family protein [Cohnella rhizosphaerae]